MGFIVMRSMDGDKYLVAPAEEMPEGSVRSDWTAKLGKAHTFATREDAQAALEAALGRHWCAKREARVLERNA